MHRFSRRSSLAGLVLAQNEGAHHHAQCHPTEQAVDVLISLRSSLLIELLINGSLCHEAGSGSFAATAKVRGKRVDLVDEGGIAGLHGLLQARLVKERTVGDDRSSDGNEDTAANVANEVDDPRDLIARLFRKSDISRAGDGDEGERNREHLKNSQPGGKTEGHGEREVSGSVIERAGEAEETECSHVSRRKPTSSYSCQGHNDEQSKSSACERLSGAGCRVAHQLLQELGLKYGCGIQDAADQNHEETADSEVLVLKQPQVHDRVLGPPLPPDQAGHTRNE
jgi:hypothetical protein